MLESHLLWRGLSSDQFVSWTGSLLWVLQHAIRKDFRGEKDVQICVLDTTKIETCSFFAASDLLRIYQVSDEVKLSHRYYTTEYLYHGGLSIHGYSSTVSLNLLREYGLFALLPELDDLESKRFLCRTVESLRVSMVSLSRPIAPIEGRTALQVASLFEKSFTMPVMVALLSLRRRAPDDEQFLKLVVDYAGRQLRRDLISQTQTNSEPEPSRDFTDIIPPYRNAGTEAPELANFVQLMNRAYAETVRPKPRYPDEELGHALDALSAGFDEVDTTLKGISRTVLTPNFLLQWSTATQALRNVVYINWARGNQDPRFQPKDSRPKPFPVRLPSGSVAGLAKSRARKMEEPLYVKIED